MTKGRK